MQSSGASPATGRVLVVDDAADGCEILSRYLRRAGFAVDTAGNGQRALELAASRPYDTILLDIMMPGMDGVEVLRTLRMGRPPTELPVIMVTAVGESEQIVSALGFGANDYVTKPLDHAVVIARLRTQIALKRAVEQVHELQRGLSQRNRELQEANARMRTDLDAAARIQASLLPPRDPDVPGYRFSWLFRPSAELGGDFLNIFRLDTTNVGLYVLDVSGHGVAAALLSVTVERFLSPAPDSSSILWRQRGDGDYELEPPARVAERLSHRFPFDTTTCQYFTLLYGILCTRTHRLRYVSAGHPTLVRVPRAGAADVLDASGYPIGLNADTYDEYGIDLAPGDRLYAHSDGITDALDGNGQLFDKQRMLDLLDATRHLPLESGLNRLDEATEQWATGAEGDDRTVLAVEREREG